MFIFRAEKKKKKTFTRTARVPELVWAPPLYSDISWLQPWSADVMAAVTFGNLRIRSVDGAAAHGELEHADSAGFESFAYLQNTEGAAWTSCKLWHAEAPGEG